MARWIVCFVVAAACGGAPARPSTTADARPSSAAEPRYPVPAEVGQLVIDDAKFAELARALRRDAEASLQRASNARFINDRRFVLALLDALDGRWRDAVAKLDQIREREPDPRAQVMTGLTIRVWADALDHGGDPAAFGAALERRLATMPTDLVREELSELRTMGQVFSPETCKQLVDRAVRVERGTMSFDDASAVAFQRYAVVRLVPVGAELDRVLAAHGIAAKTE